MEHSKLFPPSSAYRWSRCTGSIDLCKDVDEPNSTESVEGTAAHHLLEQMLQGFRQRTDGDGILAGKEMVGTTAPNGFIVTSDMFDNVLVAYEDIVEIVGNDVKNKAMMKPELVVKCSHLHDQAWGTMDAGYYDPKSNTVYVWDLKYGHKVVEPEGNEQLVMYAEGLVEALGVGQLNPRVIMTILQPRLYDGTSPVKRWVVQYSDLQAHLNTLKHAIDVYVAGRSVCQSGSHCLHCPARTICQTHLRVAAGLVDLSEIPVTVELSDDNLANELTLVEEAIDRLKGRIDALESEAEARIKKGKIVPGWALRESYGHNAWKIDAEKVYMIGDMIRVDFRDTKPKSPLQVKKALKSKGIDESVISEYVYKPSRGLKLVKDDGSKAKAAFNNGGKNV